MNQSDEEGNETDLREHFTSISFQCCNLKTCNILQKYLFYMCIKNEFGDV